MSFNIEFDYRFDTNGFFDVAERKAALEAAAEIWEDFIKDDFADVPVGSTFSIDHPSDPGNRVSVTLDAAIDDLVIFVGSDDFDILGIAGFDGVDLDGDIYSNRISGNFRGEVVSNFEPWAGTMTFNQTANWNFSLDEAVKGQSDFLSVALHEIAHVLGIGTSAIFKEVGKSGSFEGYNTMALNGGDPVPLQAGLGHVAEGFDDNTVLLDPFLTVGTRTLPGRFDLALLADIGYEIEGLVTQGQTPPIATQGDDIVIFGSQLADRIDGLGGDDQIQGAEGDDSLNGGAGNDTLFGGSGNDILIGGLGDDLLQGSDGADALVGGFGTDWIFGQADIDTFQVTAGGGQVTIADFDLSQEVIVLEGSGFATVQEVVDAVIKPFSNVSQVTFEDGTTVRVFHASQSGSPLREANFRLIDKTIRVTGDGNDNVIVGGAKAEILEGLGGNDVLEGGGGADTIDGGSGSDTWAAAPNAGAVEVDLSAQTAADGLGDVDTLIFVENARGGLGNDILIGSEIANILDGGAGRDTMIGAGGDDTYVIENRRDRVVEFADEGFDTILASAQVFLGESEIERVVLEGRKGQQVIGNQYTTEIRGSAGSDTLAGGGGGDVLTGGAGGDFFAFQQTDAPGGARITDFSKGDKIALDDRFFGLGDGSIDVRDVTQAMVSNAIRLETARYNGSTGELWIDQDGRNGPQSAELIAIIEGGGPLGADDLLLF